MILYKYFPVERRDFLDKLAIRFTQPDLFNDPYDSFPAYKGFDETLINAKVNKVTLDIAFTTALETSTDGEGLRILNSLPQTNAILKKHYLSNPAKLDEIFGALHRKRINSEIGVLCLCSTSKSVVMWSHYACEHMGFVIGFESEDYFFSHHPDEPTDIGKLTHVNYSDKRPCIDIGQIKEGATFPDILFTKNVEWQYEQEYRIIRFLKQAEDIRANNIHLFKVPPTAIREVIFGSCVDSLTSDTLQTSLKQNPQLKHIQMFKAELSKLKYEMDIVPL